MGGCVIAVGETSVFKTVETALTKANLDQGSDFAHGSDYYIYICDPGTDDQDEIYLISLNSSWPDGDAWDDTNTRKLGGFHYGRVRNVDDYGRAINTSGSVRGSGWESNTRVDIIPNSVWTTKHRPKCDPSGMVYLGNALWGDIYLSSDDGANGLQPRQPQRAWKPWPRKCLPESGAMAQTVRTDWKQQGIIIPKSRQG